MAEIEISQSKIDIEGELNQTINVFSYPNGNFNLDIINLVKKCGFTCAVIQDYKLISSRDDIFTLNRIPAFENLDVLKFILSGIIGDFNSLIKGIYQF